MTNRGSNTTGHLTEAQKEILRICLPDTEPEKTTMADSPTTADSYDATVCIRCDPVRPENVGGTVWERCPECGAWMFGLKQPLRGKNDG